MGFLGGTMVKNLPAKVGDTGETQILSLGGEAPLEVEMATLASILARKIPWAEEPGGLQSMGLQRVGHNWARTHRQDNSFKNHGDLL